MLIGYFTEQPYRGVTEEQVLKHGSYFGISNSKGLFVLNWITNGSTSNGVRSPFNPSSSHNFVS